MQVVVVMNGGWERERERDELFSHRPQNNLFEEVYFFDVCMCESTPCVHCEYECTCTLVHMDFVAQFA